MIGNLNADLDIIFTCAADVTPKPIEWIWEGWLARGKLHILAGQAGTGKTTIAIELAAIISVGGEFPDGSHYVQGGSVLIWSGEDSVENTLVPRLIAAEANLNKIYFVSDVVSISNKSKRSFDPAVDMSALITKAESIVDLAMIIIDPIVSAVAKDSHKNGEVRRALQPIVELGNKRNCAVLGITHFTKGGHDRDILERVTGSLAFGALARIVLAAGKVVGGDINKRILCRVKSNIGSDTGGFVYILEETEIKTGFSVSNIRWVNYEEGCAGNLLTSQSSSNASECIDFLREILTGDKMKVKDIFIAGSNNGFSQDQLKRAKEKLGIKSQREGFGKGAVIYWNLPQLHFTNS